MLVQRALPYGPTNNIAPVVTHTLTLLYSARA
jgi:hypothetical protein